MEPKIRFSSSNILYEEKTLSEISTINPKTNVPLEFEYVDLESVSGTEMTNHRTEHKATAPSRAQRLAKKGDIFYQTVRPYQKNNYYFDMDDDNYVFSTGYAQIRPSIYGKYLFTLLQNDSFLKQVLDNCAGTSFPAINPSVLSRLSVRICTDKQEQQAIGKYFTSLDSQISASTSRLASLKQMKAASLQAMFPQEGETVPKIRFKGFEGEWKKVIIKDICKKKSSVLSENALGENTGNYAVYGASGYIQNIATYDISTDYVGIIKDGSGVGRTKLYPAYSSLLGTMQYIIAKENCCIYFLEPLLQTIDFTTFISGSGIPHIYFRDYEDMEVSIPSLAEQQAIASYFTSLDHQIFLQTQRLEKLKQIKSACLDKMFV